MSKSGKELRAILDRVNEGDYEEAEITDLSEEDLEILIDMQISKFILSTDSTISRGENLKNLFSDKARRTKHG